MGKLDKDRKDEAIPDDLKRIADDYRGALAVFGQWGIRAQDDIAKLLEDRMHLERRRDEMLKTASLAREIFLMWPRVNGNIAFLPFALG